MKRAIYSMWRRSEKVEGVYTGQAKGLNRSFTYINYSYDLM